MKNMFFILFILFTFLSQMTIVYCDEQTYSANIPQAFRDAKFQVFEQPKDSEDFTLPLLNGGEVTLSEYRGMVVVLAFWTTWCTYCHEEMSSKEIFYQYFKDRGLEILAINYKEDSNIVSQYIDNNDYTFPVVLDLDGSVKTDYEVSGYPTCFIINREGKIIAKRVGTLNWNAPELIYAFKALL